MELESWHDWMSDDKLVSSSHTAMSNRFPGKKTAEPDHEPEVDYFQEMQLEPSIRKTKKVKVFVCNVVSFK